jgi:hypothetical protein
MSKIEVNTVEPQCGTTLTLGASGDTVTIPAGATISNLGTAAGFGSTGEVSWNTTVKTSDFTATSGSGFFINTAGGAVTVTLPASPSAGNVVAVSDYNGSAGTNTITIARNGSNINGDASNLEISKANSAIQLVYVDSTTGWQNVTTASPSDVTNPFIVATGGTITCCGDFKIHTFTGPGTFTVTNSGSASGSNTVSYMVIGGGGAGGGDDDGAGGGGSGGFRESKAATDCYSASPLNATSGPTYNLPVSVQGYPITVGGGGSSNPQNTPYNMPQGAGNPSTFSTITSAGGGDGGLGNHPGPSTPSPTNANGTPGGSGGGGGTFFPGSPGQGTVGSGNTPPVSPPQGNNGGTGATDNATYRIGGGGGGAGAVGESRSPSCNTSAGGGGTGISTSITGSSVTRAGGGGGGGHPGGNRNGGGAGPGGGGSGGGGPPGATAGAGTANTGGGGGGNGAGGGGVSGAGGSGIVVIRYKYQ